MLPWPTLQYKICSSGTKKKRAGKRILDVWRSGNKTIALSLLQASGLYQKKMEKIIKWWWKQVLFVQLIKLSSHEMNSYSFISPVWIYLKMAAFVHEVDNKLWMLCVSLKKIPPKERNKKTQNINSVQ